MPGGSPGVVPSEQKKLSPAGVVHGHGVSRASLSRVAGPEPRRYMVAGGPTSVMYGGCRTKLPLGKVLSEQAFDIDAIRRQGVKLEEIARVPVPVEPTVEVVPPPEAA